jgi:hypothetical protein
VAGHSKRKKSFKFYSILTILNLDVSSYVATGCHIGQPTMLSPYFTRREQERQEQHCVVLKVTKLLEVKEPAARPPASSSRGICSGPYKLSEY